MIGVDGVAVIGGDHEAGSQGGQILFPASAHVGRDSRQHIGQKGGERP